MHDRVAVVTGASGGIGQATALALAREGASVFVHGYQNRAGLADTMNALGQLGVHCESFRGDLAQNNIQNEIVDRAWQWANTLGRTLKIWVNLAGIDVLTGDAAAASFEEKLEQLWRVDVRSTIQLSRLAGARMRTTGGCIVNVGWDQAAWGMEGDSGELFATTKGAVMAFTRSLAKSLAPSVRVNCIAPGWIKTKWGATASERWQHRAMTESLLARWGEAQDVAEAVCFLASERASFINAQVLQINGGYAGPAGDRQ